jgi:tetratricopeptide (TPR) repeat protein
MSMFAHLEAGRLDEAIKEAQSTPETEGPGTIFQMSIVGCANAAGGRRENAVQIVEKLLTMTEQYSPALVQAAAVCSRLGDKDRAFELLEKALGVRDDRLLWIKVDPRFDNLRTDERYQKLLHRMNLLSRNREPAQPRLRQEF